MNSKADGAALSDKDLNRFADKLHQAFINHTPTGQITAERGLTLDDAYQVQRRLIERRPGKLAGRKMGLTSRAKMDQMGVDVPIYGHLTEDMRLTSGGSIAHAKHCHPRCEPEIAFIMGAALKGPTDIAAAQAAVKSVCVALEVIDSRYKDFKFTLEDVVADNASSSHFVLGEQQFAPADVDISNLGMVLELNGQVKETGSSAAILDNPWRSLVELVGLLAPLGESLSAGDVVLAGAATKAVAVSPGDVARVIVDGLGQAEFSVI